MIIEAEPAAAGGTASPSIGYSIITSPSLCLGAARPGCRSRTTIPIITAHGFQDRPRSRSKAQMSSSVRACHLPAATRSNGLARNASVTSRLTTFASTMASIPGRLVRDHRPHPRSPSSHLMSPGDGQVSILCSNSTNTSAALVMSPIVPGLIITCCRARHRWDISAKPRSPW